MFILDTNVVSELRKAKAGKANRGVTEWAEEVPMVLLFMSVISLHELEHGVLLAERRDPQQGDILRQWLDESVNAAESQAVYKPGQWNTFRIVANGNRIRSWVNGVPCADFCDDMDASGFIGLQVHGIRKGTGPYQVRWRNIRIRELKPGEKVE